MVLLYGFASSLMIFKNKNAKNEKVNNAFENWHVRCCFDMLWGAEERPEWPRNWLLQKFGEEKGIFED